ncbi:uncharacterized protein V6R79_017309 [Siganus canaliculatus]
MPVRFKGQSEYQQSYRASRSRSVSPQYCAPLAGLRSDHMGISREPALQRRKKLGSGGLAQSCSSLLCPPDPPQTSRAAPSAASRSRSSPRKEPKSPTSLRAEPGTPTGPRPAADPEPRVEPRPPVEPESVKSRLHKPDSQPQLSRPVTSAADAQPLSATQVSPGEAVKQDRLRLMQQQQQHALRQAGGQRSEYLRQFGWKKAAPGASPLQTAEQQLHSSGRSVPPFKKNVVPMETEYGQSFQGLAPPTGPILRRQVEHERLPLFHARKINAKRREEPGQDVPAPQGQTPPQVQRGHRIPEEGRATDDEVPQVKELRRQASAHRRRAWGLHFSRDHLNQLRSEHNSLWEPTDSPSDSRSGRPLTSDLCHDPDGPSSSSTVEPLDMASRSGRSSRRSDRNSTAQRREEEKRATEEENQEEGEGEEEEEEEEGRLPTPRLKTFPVQRTHLDLTTPAAGGAILVGKLRSSDDSSPTKQQRCGSAVSVATGSVTDVPVKRKEAWSEPNPSHCSPANSIPHQKPATSPPSSKPIRTKEPPPSPVAPPPLIPPPHCIQGALRHADFQHNGDLGLRFRELHRSVSDEDDRLSVMSWRSAASCSMASAVLERAQKRRENFWGKR